VRGRGYVEVITVRLMWDTCRERERERERVCLIAEEMIVAKKSPN
jgi:hypothetical protein